MDALAGISVRKITTYGIFILSAYAAWARSGVYPPLQAPLLIASFLLLFIPMLLGRARLVKMWAHMRRDAVFWLGLIFMALLLVQFINSGYRVVFGDEGSIEMVRPPPDFLPWSVEPQEAGEMFVWFFPAWIAVLLIRNLLHRSHVTQLLILMAVNSFFLGLAGLIIALSGSDNLLGIWPLPYTVFFASFSYANHACAWFYMNAFLAGGLAYRALIRKQPLIQIAVWSIIFLVCTLSLFFTQSRFGVVIASGLLGTYLFVFLRTARKHMRLTLNIYIFSALLAVVGLALFFGVGGGRTAEEIQMTHVMKDLSARFDQYPVAFGIIGDYPFFGSGGWGSRWLYYFYVPEDQWEGWWNAGMANVHCDPLQFMSEFGIIGSLLLGAVSICLTVSAVRSISSIDLPIFLFVGISLVFFHSFFDLPFRCPAILLEWNILMAAIPRIANSGRLRPDPLSSFEKGIDPA